MNNAVRKLIRTVQSELGFLKEAKDSFYLHSRRVLKTPHELEFRALRFLPHDLPGCYVDVGANQGQSIESIKLMQPGARIVSFEANLNLAEKLQKRYRGRGDITVHPFGLSDEVQQRTLFVPIYRNFVYDGNASLDRESAMLLYSSLYLYLYSPAKLRLQELPCSLKRLDDMDLEPCFIKIDVQGFEMNVVKGGLETIKRHEPILMVECLHDHPGLFELLQQLGYKEYWFDEQGFTSNCPPNFLNQIVMTERRARQVRMSPNRSDGAGATAAVQTKLETRLATAGHPHPPEGDDAGHGDGPATWG